MKYDLKRYDVYGWDYEHVSSLTESQVAWYTRFASLTGGPVLELACGTARLMEAIARAGFQVDGIDLSQGMLDRAERRISLLPSEIRSRVRVHHLDMKDFDLGREFGLVVLADNSFRELATRSDQVSCLVRVYRHLRPDGRFLVTVRRFDPARFAPRDHISWSSPMVHPCTGSVVQRKVFSRLSTDGKWIEGSMVYRTRHPDQSETVDDCPFRASVLRTKDYLSMFSQVGFATNVFVGYEEIEDDGEKPIICFVCNKRA